MPIQRPVNFAAQTALQKALATTGSGSNLVPEDLEPLIRDYLWYMSPLTAQVPLITADGHIHNVVRRTAINRGWFEGESTDPTYGQSTYDRRPVNIKIIRVHGKVTDFQQSASRSFTDSLEEEIFATTMGFADLFEFSTIWGLADDIASPNLTGDAYQYSGLYGWLLEDDVSGSNVRDSNSSGAAGATVTLSMLDKAYAQTVGKYKNLMRDPYLWLMSQDMIDKVSGLQTRIQRDAPTVEFEGGFVMNTYKRIPIVPSQFCSPGSASPASPAATAIVGGSLEDDEYFYRVAAITLYGEQVAGTEVSATTSGTHNTVRLSWTADANAKLYAIYRGLATGDNNLGLLDIIAAKTYNASGAVTANVALYDDDGTLSTNATLNTTVQPFDTGEESIFLVNIGKTYGMSRLILPPTKGTPVTNEFDPASKLLNYEEVPVATDEYAFRLKSYHAVQVPNALSCAMVRRAKTT
ncbi:MAG: hypothetical protein ACW98Y_15120 [Candidatus Thorarchaeota archaeon]|jgi:hypothetical protein